MDVSIEIFYLLFVFLGILNLNCLIWYALLCSLLLSFNYESCRFSKLVHVDLLPSFKLVHGISVPYFISP